MVINLFRSGAIAMFALPEWEKILFTAYAYPYRSRHAQQKRYPGTLEVGTDLPDGQISSGAEVLPV
jgi:hypothetical protein